MRTVKSTAGIGRYHWDWHDFRYLVEVTSQAKGIEELLNLFIDIHTPKEIAEIVRRVIIASYIIDGKTYDEIAILTGASRNTISKINQKMWRKKSVLNKLIVDAGMYKKEHKRVKADGPDPLTRIFGPGITKHDIFHLLPRI